MEIISKNTITSDDLRQVRVVLTTSVIMRTLSSTAFSLRNAYFTKLSERKLKFTQPVYNPPAWHNGARWMFSAGLFFSLSTR